MNEQPENSTEAESGDSDSNWWDQEADEFHQTSKTAVAAEAVYEVKGRSISYRESLQSLDAEEVAFNSETVSKLERWPSQHIPFSQQEQNRSNAEAALAAAAQEEEEEAEALEALQESSLKIPMDKYSADAFMQGVHHLLSQFQSIAKTAVVRDVLKVQLDVCIAEVEKLAHLIEDNERETYDSDVDALLALNTFPWDFLNEEVDAFRARAVRFPHEEFLQTDLATPRYFCGSLLPRNTADFVKTNVRVLSNTKQIQITLTSHDTAVTLIGKVYDMFAEREEVLEALGSPGRYILKVVGIEEYMYGSELLYNSEAVRAILRENKTLDLLLMPRPESQPIHETIHLNTECYWTKVNADAPVLLPDDFVHTAQTGEMLERSFLPLREMRRSLRIRIHGVEHVNTAALPRLDSSITQLRVESFLFHGMTTLKGWNGRTPDIPRTQAPRWKRWFGGENSMRISDLPRETRVCFLLYGRRAAQKESVLLGWVGLPLIDPFGELRSGMLHLNMWPVPVNVTPHLIENKLFVFRGSACQNMAIYPGQTSYSKSIITIEFEQYALPVAVPISEKYEEPSERIVGGRISWKKLEKSMRARVDNLIKMDPLCALSEDDKKLLWLTRHHLQPYPLALPKFLQSVDWTSTSHKNEAHRLLSNWTPPLNPVSALELLDVQYADYEVREYAVNCLRVLPDDELQLFLLQLTQIIKNEPYHDSPLIRFLMERALRNPLSIGHALFWHLKAEMHDTEHCERYALILEEYLHHSGLHAVELRKQFELVQRLERISALVLASKRGKVKTDEEIMREYQLELQRLNETFLSQVKRVQIPLNPKWLVTTLIVEKCRYMSSKMAPLFLTFNNADPLGEDIIVMFKSGDDLRQDMLTLQLLRVMDKIWVSEDLDMRLSPYRCVSTGVNAAGKGVGMIEIVKNSETTSGIQLKYGGGALGALKLEPLQRFISDHNKDKEQFERAQDNFTRSCSGYCVATYVLGIGDRHNGNIMVRQDGHLFHIDFGHILGNFKSKFGVKRERAAFVFTPEMAYVMGGRKYMKSREYKAFIHLSAQAFTSLRNHASLFINLFSLMVSANMPELMQHEDIYYLRDKFFLDETEEKAVKELNDEMTKSVKGTYRIIDNLFHNLMHGQG